MSRPLKIPDLVRADLPDGETVVRVDGGDSAVILNAIGDAVLSLCDGTRTVADIAEFLRLHVAVPDTTDLDADVTRVVAELVGAGLVTGGDA
jgi:hypothetical protein